MQSRSKVRCHSVKIGHLYFLTYLLQSGFFVYYDVTATAIQMVQMTSLTMKFAYNP